METNEVELNKILNIFFQVCEISSEYCKKIEKGEIKNNVHYKEKNEKFTDIDWLIQKLIENIISKYFPYIKIIGEEDTSINIGIDEKNNNFLSQISNIDINKNYFSNEYNYKISLKDKITLFMDPIDATNQLIKKNFDPVTILIGICINDKPKIGIIHYLSELESHKKITYFNYPEKGVFTFYKNEINKVNINKFNGWKFLISYTRSNNDMYEFIKNFENAEYEKIHGCGNKCIKVILNDYCYFSNGNYAVALWDICASHCIVQEIGGGFYNFKGEEIKYDYYGREYIKDYIFLISDNKRKDNFVKNGIEFLKKKSQY